MYDMRGVDNMAWAQKNAQRSAFFPRLGHFRSSEESWTSERKEVLKAKTFVTYTSRAVHYENIDAYHLD